MRSKCEKARHSKAMFGLLHAPMMCPAALQAVQRSRQPHPPSQNAAASGKWKRSLKPVGLGLIP